MFDKKNLPALDDENLRKLNTKKVVDSIEQVGSYLKTAQKNQRIAIISGLIFIGLLLVIVVGGFGYTAYKNGNPLEVWFDADTSSTKYVCHNSPVNATFRYVADAVKFRELFPNSTCNYYSIRK